LRKSAVIGVDPASPRKVGQNREEKTWKPVVDEHTREDDKEPLDTARARPVLVLDVKRSEKRNVDQVGRPDHG
jgi:hypothetical protein